jgi:hypothetical protein
MEETRKEAEVRLTAARASDPVRADAIECACPSPQGPSKAERVYDLAQHFTRRLGVPPVIKGLVQTGKEGETRDDDSEALQHSSSPRAKEAFSPASLSTPRLHQPYIAA